MQKTMNYLSTEAEFSVCIVLVVHKAINVTLECLSSIEQSKFRNLEIIIVINDGLKSSYDDITAFTDKSDKKYSTYEIDNKGFANACNYGVQHTSAEFIWLLNNDCTIPSNSIEGMLAAHRDREKLILGSIITKPDGYIQCIGGGVLNMRLGIQKQLGYDMSYNSIDVGSIEHIISELDFITGASLFMKRKEYLELGEMDEKFFMYWEETDFCFRAKKKGFSFDVCKSFTIEHKIGASTDITSSFTEYYSSRNAIIFFSQYMARKDILLLALINAVAKIFNRIRRREFGKIKVVLSAIIDGLNKKCGRNFDY